MQRAGKGLLLEISLLLLVVSVVVVVRACEGGAVESIDADQVRGCDLSREKFSKGFLLHGRDPLQVAIYESDTVPADAVSCGAIGRSMRTVEREGFNLRFSSVGFDYACDGLVRKFETSLEFPRSRTIYMCGSSEMIVIDSPPE